MKKTQPFLKWAGGKTQLLPSLVKHVPKTYEKYIEPMIGGGALFFYLCPQKAVLSDSNSDLINAYQIVRDNVKALINALKHYNNDEDLYYQIRGMEPELLDPIDRAARMIFLNKTCFNGLYRVNKQGKFNVPFGKRKNPKICDEINLLAAHEALQNVELVCADYKSTIKQYAKKGDFIYIDPPYHPVGEYSDFKRYTKERFFEEDHVELRDVFIQLIENECLPLITNSNTPYILKLYEAFDYEVVNTRRNISSNALTRANGQDLIVFPPANIRTQKSTQNTTNGGLLEHFPGTRFMGSKYSVLPFIWQCVKDLRFESVLDAFSGSSCVSYMFKRSGKRVISNDFMHFTYHFANALIENSDHVISNPETQMLVSPNNSASTFISDTFQGLYFSDEENAFLDSLLLNIEALEEPYKKSLAFAAISRACLKKRPRGIFTYTGERYDDGRRDLRMSLQEHFLANIEAFNAAVFTNGRNNLAINSDVFDLNVDADLVYLDPPYYTPKSDNEYTRRYHFVEGLVRNWEGLKIEYHTKTKKFERYNTPFTSKDTIVSALDRLFSKFKDSILVVSYSSNSLPGKGEIVAMLKTYKKNVLVHQINHLYSFGTHNHRVNSNANRVQEYIFIAY
ncbi:MAG: Dam family site-specific DNA-(adenine-N6)-methyltransferase [Chloroflexi bacterium]|jgi:DNA adenine methylase|nr:Dam family site-specific DNA-(adenine-N6)-methyltransferase [Chloroflexota bacterium]